MRNLILNADSYKCSHYLQTPPKTQFISSYIEARGGKYDFAQFFGLQMLLPELVAPTYKQVKEAEEIIRSHGFKDFNSEGWNYIARLGYLPICIQAVKEGLNLPTQNVLVQVVNTDPRVPWLTSYLETMLLRVWYPITVSTRSKLIKKIIKAALEDTCDNPDAELPFKLHDFGFRGVSSYESGAIGGVAHLVNFMGTDTMGALVYAREHYGETMAGYSIPSAEHSTITSWGRDGEAVAYKNMLDKFGSGLVGVVSDSYDIYNACANIWPSMKDQLEKMGGTLVVRPDSGNPETVPVECIQILGEKFGTTVNSKGYKVLPSYLRVIQGDGINEDTIPVILANLKAAGYSAENIAFGMGGEMLQTMNRDTMKFAMKANAIKRDGDVWQDVTKNPVTDPGKKSKGGRLALIKDETGFSTIRETDLAGRENLLEDVFRDGDILRTQSLSDVRELSNAG